MFSPSFIFSLSLAITAGSLHAAIDSDFLKKEISTFSKKAENTGVIVLVKEQKSSQIFTAGYANKESKSPIKPNDLFEIGSASKVFTGIAIHQLIEQGKLTLNTPIQKFYPSGKITNLGNYKGKNHWGDITVGMLLKHTSGIIDYLNAYGDDAKSIQLFSGADKVYTFDQLIKLATDHGDANFIPGAQFKYSNTGYVILGDIIGKVSGENWRDYIQKHIIDSVGMRHTYFGSRISKKLRSTMPQGYYNLKPSFMPPTLANSAGEIISTLDDLALLMTAWNDGKLYKNPETLKNQQSDGFLPMTPATKNLTFGYGVMKIGGFYGHAGQTFGFQSYIAIHPKTKKIIIIGINDAAVSSIALFTQLTHLSLFE